MSGNQITASYHLDYSSFSRYRGMTKSQLFRHSSTLDVYNILRSTRYAVCAIGVAAAVAPVYHVDSQLSTGDRGLLKPSRENNRKRHAPQSQEGGRSNGEESF